MAIRPRTDADLSECVAVLRAVHEVDGYPSRWIEDPEAFLFRAPLGAWVAHRNRAIIGHVALTVPAMPLVFESTGWSPDTTAAVARLFTAPDGRRMGVGAALLDAAVQRAWELGRRPVLDVLARAMPAIAMYERSGWRFLGADVATWTDRDGTHPLVRYYAAPDAADC
ncbi:MAG: GNAT family N-acetyltransferase [Jatrophihabitans sp.]